MSIGAAVTHRRLSDHPAVREHLPTLAAAASRVGNARVRSTGTVGGNLCFAEPRSDLGCVLVALGRRRRGPLSPGAPEPSTSRRADRGRVRDLARSEDEILTTLTVPFEPPGMSYWKLQSYERPTLGVASGGHGVPVGDHRWRGHRAPHPRRASPRATPLGWAAFVDGLELSDDMTGPPAYKRSVLRAHLERTLGTAR